MSELHYWFQQIQRVFLTLFDVSDTLFYSKKLFFLGSTPFLCAVPTRVHPLQSMSGPCSIETMYPCEWRIAIPVSLMWVEYMTLRHTQTLLHRSRHHKTRRCCRISWEEGLLAWKLHCLQRALNFCPRQHEPEALVAVFLSRSTCVRFQCQNTHSFVKGAD